MTNKRKVFSVAYRIFITFLELEDCQICIPEDLISSIKPLIVSSDEFRGY